MSSGRLHIPFPRTFLSLNTPAKKSRNPSSPTSPTATQPEQLTHPFLSNRAGNANERHASISSVSSVDSVASAPSPTSNEPSASPVLKPTLPAFLSLNAKYAAPPKAVQEMKDGDQHSFLSNRH